MKILLFAGTTEGRELANALDRPDVELTVCVATAYGAQLIGALRHGRVRTGRLETEEMCRLAAGCDAVVDATHPYADAASRNIAAAAERCGVRLLRVRRPASALEGLPVVDSAAEAARIARECGGNVLLTTGAKELPAFAGVERERLFVRVLPSVESLEACRKAGVPAGNIIALQGPFGEELNRAILRAYGIRLLVTKDGGRAGGFAEKIAAAASCGVQVVVIRRPRPDEGLTPAEIRKELLP